MRKAISIFFLFNSFVIFSQNYGWITPNKNYLKLFVIEDATYRINKNNFVQNGINTSNIDPRTVKVFYKGNEVPIYFEGEQDGSFDDNDFLDFYGTRNRGGLTNTYKDESGTMVVHYTTEEFYNQYSDTSVYWIGWDGANGIRYTNSNFTTTNNYLLNYSFNKIHFEKDSVYSLGETFNINFDFRPFNNDKVSGEGWYWRNLTPLLTMILSQPFTLTNLSPNSVNCSFRIFAYPNSKDASFNEHKVVLRINSTNITTLLRNDYDRFDTTVSFPSSLLTNGPNSASIFYEPTFTSGTPSLYFDLIELSAPQTFRFVNNKIRIELSGTDTTSEQFSVAGFNSSNPISIYDVKNNYKITNISGVDTLFFTGKKNGTFEINNQNITKKPFRMQTKQVPNLVSPSKGADYLIIYNNLFSSAAENLRSHRENFNGYRSFKAELTDVYDIFNFGMEDPVALRRFTNHVYQNWAGDKVQFVCLLGRGSLDPKHNLTQYSLYQNYIPVYGNPNSDGYFANFNFGTFTYYRMVPIGRLPAYTQQEANDMVSKIISYDNLKTNPERWWKNFIMITGGNNRPQQIAFQQIANELLSSHIIPPLVSMEPRKIYRNDSSGYITYNYKDSIINEINRGALIVNFIGHAAFQDWEIGLQDPNELANGYKQPFVLSMTCFTGKHSEVTQRGFGEKFVYLPNKGAIGFLGSTGWSFSSSGNQMNDFVLQNFSRDTVRALGSLIMYATQQLDSNSFSNRNMINSYDLLGDPATKLLLPAYPEFVFVQGDYRISNPYPLLGENVNLTVYPKNYGLYANNCVARFQILKSGSVYRQKDTLITTFKLFDTLRYSFRLDTIGNYSMKVTLDPDDLYPQEIPTNNILSFPIPLRNISYTPLKPVYNQLIKKDSVEFSGLNPQVNPATNSIKIILQVDTSKNFINPIFGFTSTTISGVATRFKYQLPFLDSNKVYFWRTNSIVNNDSVGWSTTMRFVYNPPASTFDRNYINTSRSLSDFNDSNITIYQKLPGQFESAQVSNLFYNGSGYELNNFTGQLVSHSHGSSGAEASYFIINTQQIYSDGGQNPGLNLAKVSRLTGKLIQFRNFRMTTSSSSDSVLNFLNTFDTAQYLMVYIASDIPNSDSLRQNAKNKFRQFGSFYADSVTRFNEFDTWAFIGYLNAKPSAVSEEFHNYPTKGCLNFHCPSDASLMPTFLNTSGSIIFNLGPAHRWKNFSWQQTLFPNSNILFDVYGIKTDEQQSLLASNISTNTFVQLDSTDYFVYPNLLLKSKINIDTLSGLRSPVFNSMKFKYTPPAEIIPDLFSIVRSDSVVAEGAEVTITLKNFNVGFVPANGLISKWTANTSSGIVTLKIDTSYIPLQTDSSRTYSVTFSTNGLRDPKVAFDSVTINYEVQHLGRTNDYFPFNNYAFTTIVVTGDTSSPNIEVTYDGKTIIDGDVIQAKPEIVFKFYDESKSSYNFSDTNNIYLKLNNQRIFYTDGGIPNPLIEFNPVNNGNLKTIVTYHPNLTEGDHRFDYWATDKNNHRDTLVDFVNVSFAFLVRDLYNVPNPTRGETYFTFNLFAPTNPGHCRIKIYTVAGRLVKEISTQGTVGYNQIYWDGRDSDGEIMANGIYLYKLILEDTGKTETAIQKLAILK